MRDRAPGRCEAQHRQAHPVTGSLVMLTMAHRDHGFWRLPADVLTEVHRNVAATKAGKTKEA